jgi:aquaporin Z
MEWSAQEDQAVSNGKKGLAEFIGTFWLVLGGCGTAVLAGDHVGWLGVSLAFGLTVVTMAYAIGHISGCHLNPAVSCGLAAGGRMPAKDLPVYIIAQVLGGLTAALVLMIILSGGHMWETVRQAGFAANGFGEHSPKGFGLGAAFLAELVLTFIFLIVIHGATDDRAPKGLAGLAIGLTLTLIHLISIPITNTSVNPARSTSQAIFVGGWALSQLWLFWVAPILGGVLGGLVYKSLGKKSV